MLGWKNGGVEVVPAPALIGLDKFQFATPWQVGLHQSPEGVKKSLRITLIGRMGQNYLKLRDCFVSVRRFSCRGWSEP
jgi:hypothetical protein